MKKRTAISILLLPVLASLLSAARHAKMKLCELNAVDSRAKRFPSSAVTISQESSNVVVVAEFKRWPNLLTIQTEQWHTNRTHVLGFVVGYRGVGKGVAQRDLVSWTIPNAMTQDISRLRVLQFPDIHVHIDNFNHKERDRQQSTGE
jgi:hypothetical protein